MKVYELRTRIRLPRPRGEVFEFFGDAGNLQALTPPWLHFEILTPSPIEMRPGSLIEYRLKLHGIPIRWRTRITVWEPPRRFVDQQLKGPYRLWDHEHTFEEDPADPAGATLATDRVRYAVLGGALVNRLLVQGDVEKIFAFRHQKLREIFSTSPWTSSRFTSAPPRTA
ncbi:MAG TPA: SRPBCC family protein [Thermoanaerobaculia bacterium]|nr:SRPBCC family protein [Thermoanaerobaculia bacterium]